MKLRKKVLTIFGTRPEAIKMAPVVKCLDLEENIEHAVCITAQHREMLDQILNFFEIKPKYDLNLMKKGQRLDVLISKIIEKVGQVIREYKPDLVILHGDTATTLGGAIASYYNQISICHVEAGLRTKNFYYPWPEEGNRSLVGRITNLHFAPTVSAEKNLIKEGVNPNTIYVVGNTVVDAVKYAKSIIFDDNRLKTRLKDKFSYLDKNKKTILVTTHRRENFGKSIAEICKAINELAEDQDLQIIFPVHLNPSVSEPVQRILSGKYNIHLIKPQDYVDFIFLMSLADLVLTDSGGIQEEAPSLGKSVLLMRENTERPEALDAGVVSLVGADAKSIVRNVKRIISNPDFSSQFSNIENPFGDGHSSNKITAQILNFLKLPNGEQP